MVDMIDRRSAGKNLTPEGKREKAKRQRAKLDGVCTYCFKQPVSGRVTCYKCSEKTKNSVQNGVVRSKLLRHDLTVDELLSWASKIVTTTRAEALVTGKVINFLQEVKKKTAGRKKQAFVAVTTGDVFPDYRKIEDGHLHCQTFHFAYHNRKRLMRWNKEMHLWALVEDNYVPS